MRNFVPANIRTIFIHPNEISFTKTVQEVSTTNHSAGTSSRNNKIITTIDIDENLVILHLLKAMNAPGSVGYTTAALRLTLLVNLLLFDTMNVFIFKEMSEAAAIPNHNDPEATDGQILEYTHNWRLITRAEWGARTPASSTNFTGPAPYVILHHSYQPGICRTEDACKASMRSMQNFHMNSHGWPDIGYSFAVGGDGNVYEGRGYEVVGAHAPNYNSRSIGLLLIGNFMEDLPPAPMLQVAQDFIKYSTEGGHLSGDYILHGHRQVRNTECPGAALYAVIKEWPHWQDHNLIDASTNTERTKILAH